MNPYDLSFLEELTSADADSKYRGASEAHVETVASVDGNGYIVRALLARHYPLEAHVFRTVGSRAGIVAAILAQIENGILMPFKPMR